MVTNDIRHRNRVMRTFIVFGGVHKSQSVRKFSLSLTDTIRIHYDRQPIQKDFRLTQ